MAEEECFVIEDSKNGVAAAKSAGMKCLGYQSPNSRHQDACLASRIISSIGEMALDMLMVL